ncbi:hypothetical protein [Thiothrix lacustris]|uniref:hypothetical protein n=1 Tax=Thiothrix lacustris TaxID=525917 RepID=UPI00056FAB00|nr:hypothetical protein [Thiothrix lacustris]
MNTSPEDDFNAPATLNDDQHTALYEAYHLVELIHYLSSNQAEFVEIRQETLSVVCGIITDRMEQVTNNLFWRPKA